MVPLKPLPQAKSRLAGAVPEGARQRLALAFAQDTVAAALACARVRELVVVTDDPEAGRALSALGARVVRDLPGQPGPGLNAALAHGARTARGWCSAAPVAALNADLPALRAAELGRVLDEAAHAARSFVADAAGVGTTLLSAAPGVELAPAFGRPSAFRHRVSGAREVQLTGVDSVRRDVDTVHDLNAALRLGVGPHTARVLAAHRERPPASAPVRPCSPS